MTTRLYTHEACFDHDPGRMHPEQPARLKAVLAALEDPVFSDLDRQQSPKAEVEQITRVHPEAFVKEVLSAVPQTGHRGVDPDTILSPGSGEAALRAAGAVCAAVDAVMAEEIGNAFCAVRPPGHHAEPTRAMGFCLFNNVAIGALHARVVHRVNRVAVVDFDVHHGNGTQAAFWADPDLFFASTHQMPLYPGTGSPTETGSGDNILNVGLHPMAGSAEFREAMSLQVLPRLAKFQPDFVLISAGFDAHVADPLASLCLNEDDFGWATTEIARIAESSCGGRLVSTLEGGYDLEALANSAAAHVQALMEA